MALNMHVILWSLCLRSAVVLRQSTDKMRDHHSALHAQISVIPCEKKTTGIEHPGTWLIGGSLKNMEIDSFFTSCPEVKKGRKKKIHLQKTAEILPTDDFSPDRRTLFAWRCAKQDVVVNVS